MRPARSLAALLCAACLTAPAAAVTARQSTDSIYISGQPAVLSAYTISENNYVRLRDFAAAAGCSVTYHADTASIHLKAGQPYDPTDETAPPHAAAQADAQPARQTVYVNSVKTDLQGCSIGGYNYFRLRDLGRALGWSVLYNGAQNRVEVDPRQPYFEKHRNTIVYMYHALTEDPAVLSAQPDLYTSPWKLQQDIRQMRALGYTCISLEDYYQGKAEPGKKYFILTFDDGYLNNYTLAYPVLQAENAPASIFTIVREMENEQGAFFTAAQAKEMEDSGLVRVYAHNLDHASATAVNPWELDRMLTRAYDSLTERLGDKTQFFAYPYGSHSKSTYTAVRDHGFRLQMVQKRQFPADDVLVRQNVRYDNDMAGLVKQAYHN